ncbi:hypothetical protein ES705_25642 [subsurface metagenome]
MKKTFPIKELNNILKNPKHKHYKLALRQKEKVKRSMNIAEEKMKNSSLYIAYKEMKNSLLCDTGFDILIPVEERYKKEFEQFQINEGAIEYEVEEIDFCLCRLEMLNNRYQGGTLQSKYMRYLDSKIKELSKKPVQSKKPQMSFEDLFWDAQHAEKVRKILKESDYTVNGKWTHKGKKNTLATAYHVLADSVPTGEIHAIKPGMVGSQLKTFYQEFGLIIDYKLSAEVYSTIKNATKRPDYDINQTPDYKTFLELFQPLKDQSTKIKN